MESLNLCQYTDDCSDDTLPVIGNISLTDILWTVLSTVMIFVVLLFLTTFIRVLIIGQKTRNPQQRRGGIYVGSRARPSLGPHEPTIYVSPSNLPPPPKYEFMAPPSYEEVVGTHYPNYQAQPITQPITAALAQPTQSTAVQANDTRPNDDDTRNNSETVVTVNERATVTSS